MTVVAFKDGIMAADRQVQADKDFIYGETKLRVFTDIQNPIGMPKRVNLVGAAGQWDIVHCMWRWMSDGAVPDTLQSYVGHGTNHKDEYAYVLWFDGESLWEFSSQGRAMKHDSPYMAIGSGAAPAMAVMHSGANAMYAVDMACLTTATCGLGTNSLDYRIERKKLDGRV